MWIGRARQSMCCSSSTCPIRKTAGFASVRPTVLPVLIWSRPLVARGCYDSRYSTALIVLFVMVALVLLVASANVANLLLARSTARAREVAIRLCAGGSRARLIRQFLTESSLLALCGGTLGVAMATWGAEFILALLNATETPVVLDVAPNLRVLAFTFGVSIAVGVAFGLVPALKSTRLDLAAALKAGSQQATRATGSSWRKSLLVTQFAMCATVVIVAAVLAETLVKLRGVERGFDGDDVLLLAIADTPDEARMGLAERLATEVSRLPGVFAAASAASTPVHTAGSQRVVRIPGVESAETRDAWSNVITPGYFDALRIPIIRGRGFDGRDSERGKKVAIVNETLARSYFTGIDPVGRTLLLGADAIEPVEIVGLAGDAPQESLRETPPRMIYTPFAQSDEPPSRFTLAIRTATPASATTAGARGIVREIDPQIVVGYVRTMEQQVNGSLVRERLLAALSSTFAAITVTLALIGLYGVMSYRSGAPCARDRHSCRAGRAAS